MLTQEEQNEFFEAIPQESDAAILLFLSKLDDAKKEEFVETGMMAFALVNGNPVTVNALLNNELVRKKFEELVVKGDQRTINYIVNLSSAPKIGLIKELLKNDVVRNKTSLMVKMIENANEDSSQEIIQAIYAARKDLLADLVKQDMLSDFNDIMSVEPFASDLPGKIGALSAAFAVEKEWLIGKLLKDQAVLTFAESDKKIAICSAAYNGNWDKINELIDTATDEEIAANNNYLLKMATSSNKIDLIAKLKTHPAFKQKCQDELNYRMLIAIGGNAYETFEQLYNQGASIPSGIGSLMLKEARANNNIEKIKLLEKIGVKEDVKLSVDHLYLTYLMRALDEFQNETVVSLLVSLSDENKAELAALMQADVSLFETILEKKNLDGFSALMNIEPIRLVFESAAAKQDNKIKLFFFSIIEFTDEPETIEKLLSINAVRNSPDLVFGALDHFISNFNEEGKAMVVAQRKDLLEFSVRHGTPEHTATALEIQDVLEDKPQILKALNTAFFMGKRRHINALLQNETVQDLAGSDPRFSLYIAAFNHDWDKVKKQIANGDNFVLNLAMEDEKWDVVENLLSFPEVRAKIGNSILGAFANGDYKLVQQLYDQGEKIPLALAKIWFQKAQAEQDTKKIECLERVGEVNQGSLFVNVTDYKIDARHVHHKLSSVYDNGQNGEATRWADQRTIAFLSDGSVIDVQDKYLLGISYAEVLALSATRTDLVTLDEISDGTGIPKDKIGDVDIDLLEKDLGLRVLKIVHRPNHEITHSERVGAYITALNQLLGSKLNPTRVDKLQRMMLFSIVGRGDETGFGDVKGIGRYLYQSYRAVSAIEFLAYYKANWQRCGQLFNGKMEELYRAALVIEAMGFSKLSDLDKDKDTKPLMLILMSGFTPTNLEKLKELIRNLPNNDTLRSYSDEALKALFSSSDIKNKTNDKQSDENLKFMNLSHSTDLLRCYTSYDPEQPTLNGQNIKLVIGLYSHVYNLFAQNRKLTETGDKSIAAEVIAYFQYARKMLNVFGEKAAADVEEDPKIIKEIIENCDAITEFLLGLKDKSKYEDVKHTKMILTSNGEPREITFEEFVSELGFKPEIGKGYGFAYEEKIDINAMNFLISFYLGKSVLKPGISAINAKRFDFCHYKTQAQLGRREKIDLNNIQHRDLTKDIETSVAAIDDTPRPGFVRKTGFKFENADILKKQQEKIQKMCADGVALLPLGKNFLIEFSDMKSAKDVFSALFRLRKISKERVSDDFIKSVIGPQTVSVEIAQDELADILPFIKYRQVAPPKEHSVEDRLVDEQGNLSVISLIRSYNATVCNHNSRPLVSGVADSVSGVEYYFDQLEHPSTNRPVRRAELTPEQRSTLYDLRSTSLPIVERRLTETLPPESQSPVTENPSAEDYEAPRDVFKERGAKKNTLFTKKNPQTLLSPHGQQRLFYGEDYWRNFPIGIVFDLKKLHLHGERYIWAGNAVSNDKFWISGATKRKYVMPTITLKDLKSDLQSQHTGRVSDIFDWNELQAGNTKVAADSLLCPGDPFADDQAILSYRLTIISGTKLVRDEYHVEVPQLIAGRDPPVYYSDSMRINDIVRAVSLLKSNQYPYLDRDHTTDPEKIMYKLKCEEQTVLLDFFQSLTGIKCDQPLSYYPPIHEYDSETESYEDCEARIDAQNTQILNDYLQKLDLSEDKIKAYYDKNLAMIGGEVRERQYMQRILRDNPLTDVESIKQLLIRNVTLGHTVLIKELIDYIKKEDIKCDFKIVLVYMIKKRITEILEHPLNLLDELKQTLSLLQFLPDNLTQLMLTDPEIMKSANGASSNNLEKAQFFKEYINDVLKTQSRTRPVLFSSKPEKPVVLEDPYDLCLSHLKDFDKSVGDYESIEDIQACVLQLKEKTLSVDEAQGKCSLYASNIGDPDCRAKVEAIIGQLLNELKRPLAPSM